MTAREGTRSSTDNSNGAPTDATLIDYLDDVDGPVSLDRLVERTGATRDALKSRLEELETRGLIIVSVGLYHVAIRLVDGVEPVADGGRPQSVGDVDLPAEEIYTILSNERRRETLRFLAELAERDGESYAPVSPLAAVVCASNDDFSPATEDPDGDEQHSTYVSLVQTHLPLLHDLGAVEYYSRVQKVGPTDSGLAIAQLMDVVDKAAAGGSE